mmetsp:Transcript_9733/g.24783  ORF Transcript_9733/g.24783 Transcript_9733/m.24783 type:complete len:272 (-) Transcript_9733:336-1151(-)
MDANAAGSRPDQLVHLVHLVSLVHLQLPILALGGHQVGAVVRVLAAVYPPLVEPLEKAHQGLFVVRFLQPSAVHHDAVLQGVYVILCKGKHAKVAILLVQPAVAHRRQHLAQLVVRHPIRAVSGRVGLAQVKDLLHAKIAWREADVLRARALNELILVRRDVVASGLVVLDEGRIGVGFDAICIAHSAHHNVGQVAKASDVDGPLRVEHGRCPPAQPRPPHVLGHVENVSLIVQNIIQVLLVMRNARPRIVRVAPHLHWVVLEGGRSEADA